MIALKLAYRNLVGAGLRTWLNVGILSFTYVLIIWHQGMFSGMQRQAMRDMIRDEVAGGQYWHVSYDPYDPFSLEASHGQVPDRLRPQIESGQAEPILLRPATIYPEGRAQSAVVRGIDPNQTILDIPTASLSGSQGTCPVMIGKIMARRISLGIGDVLTIQWRDAKGTFDAVDGQIVEIMNTNVPGIDQGQMWVPLEGLRRMSALPGEASVIVVKPGIEVHAGLSGWTFRDPVYLLKDLTHMVKTKRVGGAIMYVILLFLAMLAVFDAQILSIFRRRKEIGTLMALGMVRSRVVALFTLEGAMHGLMAVAAAAAYGIPVLIWTTLKGIPMPSMAEDHGFALASRLFPYYSVWLVGGTVLIIMCTVTIVSYLPSRNISKMNPTDAIKGKLS